MHANLTQPGRPAPSLIWTASLWAIGGLLVFWLIVLLVRGAVALGRHQVAPGPGTASGSGAFVGGILGGTFGAQAGHWIWESLTRPRTAAPRHTPVIDSADDWPVLQEKDSV
jgi:hypothetical protein